LLKSLKREGRGPACDLPSAAGARLPKRLPKALSLDEIQRLLAAPDDSMPTGLRDRALMELIYGAGLRVSEAVGLRLEDLSLDTAAVRVTGKRGKTRWVPLPTLTMPWIEGYLSQARPLLDRRGRPEVFLGAKGGALSRSMGYRILESAARRAGFERAIGPHVLRHSYAVHLLRGGADLRAVQELLGHASVSTTQVYTQLDLDAVKLKYAAAHPRR
jgi:integrase/recombinase XerD